MVLNLEAGDFGDLDAGAVSGMVAGLDGSQLGTLDADHLEATLDALGADLLGGGAANFGNIAGGDTGFELLADVAGTVTVDGETLASALVADGGSTLQGDALDIFGGGLFGGQ
jgi:hypothetical protein